MGRRCTRRAEKNTSDDTGRKVELRAKVLLRCDGASWSESNG
jgi:hypothetical protein